MKKIIISIISTALLFCGSVLMAQTPSNRTAQTKIADALAQMPAQDTETYESFMTDLCSTGEDGVLSLVKMINAPGKGNNAHVEYALSGMSHFATGEGQAAVRKTMESAYIKALDLTDEVETKAFIIRQLQVVGQDDCVEALARYLNLEDLSSPAAKALATIGTEKAGQALQASLLRRMGTAKTQQSVLQAIGDAQLSVDENLIKGMVGTGDEDFKKVALYTLSRTGTKASISTLAAAAEKAGFTMEKTGANDAYIRLLDRVIAQGDIKEAEKAASDLLKKSTKAGRTGTRIAALRLLTTAQGANASKTLTNALKDNNIEYRNAALDFASEIADRTFYVNIIKSLQKEKSAQKVDILNWLGRETECPDKKTLLSSLETGIETTAVQLIIRQAGSTDFNVKQAATMALVKIGNTAAIDPIVSFLASDDAQVVALAKNALSTFNGDISSAIARSIPAASDKGKIAIVELLAMRNATGNMNNVLEI